MISHNWELKDWMSIILETWDNFYMISLQVLTKKKQDIEHIKTSPHPATPEDKGKFKSYL